MVFSWYQLIIIIIVTLARLAILVMFRFFFKKNIAIRPHNSLTPYETIANDYNDLANFYLNSLHDYKKAKANYLTAISYGKRCEGAIRSLFLFLVHSNLAEIAIQQQMYDDAIQSYNQALSYINIKTTNSSLTTLSSGQLAAVSNHNVLVPFLLNRTNLLLLMR